MGLINFENKAMGLMKIPEEQSKGIIYSVLGMWSIAFVFLVIQEIKIQLMLRKDDLPYYYPRSMYWKDDNFIFIILSVISILLLSFLGKTFQNDIKYSGVKQIMYIIYFLLIIILGVIVIRCYYFDGVFFSNRIVFFESFSNILTIMVIFFNIYQLICQSILAGSVISLLALVVLLFVFYLYKRSNYAYI